MNTITNESRYWKTLFIMTINSVGHLFNLKTSVGIDIDQVLFGKLFWEHLNLSPLVVDIPTLSQSLKSSLYIRVDNENK